MDSKKLDVSGRKAGDSPNATYKPIPDADGEDIPLTRPKSLTGSKPSTPDLDGAAEKMLPDDDKKVSPNSNVNSGDVKFVSNNEKQNGDAKIDIGEVKTAFVGMGKEELMKYANDPFWVRLRWFLFISFWLLWAGMLVGAILIIVAAPKCSPPEPRTWWEQGPLSEVKIDIPEEKLVEVKTSGVQGIIVEYDGDAYEILTNNGSEKFNTFMEHAKKNDINVILAINPVTSHMFFNQSEKRQEDYSQYYIWHSKGDNVPTNWLRPDNKSAWKFSESRQEYYLVLNDAPQLNYRYNKVIEKFVDVLKAFLNHGVKGFQLQQASFLLVGKFVNEVVDTSKTGVPMDDFNFYIHSQTQNNQDLGGLLKLYRDVVKNKSEEAIFTISDELQNLQPYIYNSSLTIDLPKHSHVFSSGKFLNASLLKHNLQSAFNILGNNWPVWERSNNNIPNDVQDFITLLLPGTTVLPEGYHASEELLKLRKTSPSIMYGNCTMYAVANDTVFAFVRVAAGNPGYLVAVNPTNNKVNVNFLEEVPIVSEEVTVQFYSSNYTEPGIEPKLKAYAKNITISPNSAIVLTYVPKSE